LSKYCVILTQRKPGRLTLSDWIKAVYVNTEKPGVHLSWLYMILSAHERNRDAERLIKMNLAIVTDVTKPIREATYILEGDGSLSVILTDFLNRTNYELEMRGVQWIGRIQLV
jgi:hypothetical protein